MYGIPDNKETKNLLPSHNVRFHYKRNISAALNVLAVSPEIYFYFFLKVDSLSQNDQFFRKLGNICH